MHGLVLLIGLSMSAASSVPPRLDSLVFSVEGDSEGRPTAVVTVLESDRLAFAAALESVATGATVQVQGARGRVFVLEPAKADGLPSGRAGLKLTPSTAKDLAARIRKKETHELQVPGLLALEILPAIYELPGAR